MIIRVSDNTITFASHTSSETYSINDNISVLLPKESYSPKDIDTLVLEFITDTGASPGKFKLYIKNFTFQGSDKYYECMMTPMKTLFLAEGTYKVKIGDIISSERVNLAQYYNVAPEHRTITLNEITAYKIDNNISIDFQSNRFTEEGEDLQSYSSFVKVMDIDTNTHIHYFNKYNLVGSELLRETWKFDDFCSSKSALFFAFVFISADRNIIYTTPAYYYAQSTNEIILLPEDDGRYKTFNRWLNSTSIYLIEGGSELRDDDDYINVYNRVIDMSKDTTTILKYDHNSEVYTFKLARFQDGIDLSTKRIFIKYKNALGEEYRALAVNVIVEDEDIIFSWRITSSVTKEAGSVLFVIECVGTIPSATDPNKDSLYLWQTLPATIEVYGSLIFKNDQIFSDDAETLPEWYKDIVKRIDYIDNNISWSDFPSSDGEG